MALLHCLAPYVFKKEWELTPSGEWMRPAASNSLWGEVDEYIQKGWATAMRGVTQSGQAVISVSFKESVQERREELPIGARSLVFDESTHQLVFRGLNKFSDLELADLVVVRDVMMHHPHNGEKPPRVMIQRKLAGFVVHIFCLDGSNIEVMSKHVLDSDHAAVARRLLYVHLGTEKQQRAFAEFLCRHKIALSCECLDPEFDFCHPIVEETPTAQLVVFSVASTTLRAEACWPLSAASQLCSEWNLPFVLSFSVDSMEAVEDIMNEELLQWRCRSEGYVLLLELPHKDLTDADRPLVIPVRFKMKSLHYRVLRCLRSTVTGEHRLLPSHEFYHHVYILCFAAWCMNTTVSSLEEVKARAREVGIWSMTQTFEQFLSSIPCQRNRKRDRDVDELPTLLMSLTRCVELQAHLRHRCPHALLMLCGLPGSGKSTLSQTLMQQLKEQASFSHSIRHVLYISRDDIAHSVAQSEGILHDASAHQQRKLRKLVHEAYVDAISAAVRWICAAEGDGTKLVILDACHAGAESRRMFRSMFPSSMVCTCVHVTCSVGPEELVRRATLRTDHAVLKAEDAVKAVQDVARVFRVPSAQQEPYFSSVVTVDTSTCSSDDVYLSKVLPTRFVSEADNNSSSHNYPSAQRWSLDEILVAEKQSITYFTDAITNSCVTLGDLDAYLVGMKRQPCHVTLKPVAAEVVKQRLWEMSLEAILSCTQSTNTAPAENTFSAVAALKRWLPKALTASQSNSYKVESGHVKWIRGKFVAPDTTGKVEQECRSLFERNVQQRYSEGGQEPHVTLHYSRWCGTAVQKRAEYMTQLHLVEGQLVDVVPTHLLIDDKALVIAVKVKRSISGIGVSEAFIDTNSEGKPLHITLGHTHHVKAAYGGDLEAVFEKWEAENRENPSHLHNFLKISVSSDASITMRVVTNE